MEFTNAVRPFGFLAVLLVVLGFLSACEMRPPPQSPIKTLAPSQETTTVTAKAVEPPISPSEEGRERPHSQIFISKGNSVGAAPPRSSATQEATGDITLNFSNADVREFVRAVFGEILKVPFAIDARVQGTVTLQTSHAIDRDSLFSVAENALRLNGLAVVKENDIFNIVPATDAPRYAPPISQGASGAAAAPGVALRIIPLRFASTDEILNVLKSVVPSDTVVQAVPSRNVLIAAGSQHELSSIADLIAIFDVDFLKGMSFALFYPKNTDAKALIGDLETVFNNGKTETSLIRFAAIERLNAILAMSRTPSYLTEAEKWVDRLDQKSDSVDERIFVYYVQNGRATDLATTLNNMLSKRANDHGSQTLASAQSTDTVQAMAPIMSPAQPPMPPGQVAALPNQAVAADKITPSDQGIRLSSDTVPQITADENHNALLIMTTPRNYRVIEAALAKLDLPPLQVLIEAVVVEVTLNKDIEYGVQWFFKSGDLSTTLSTVTDGSIAGSFPGFSTIFTNGTNIKAVLNALESITTVNVLSSPQMMVLNNQSATLQVGAQVPVATQSATSVLTPGAPIVNTIQFRDTGVILKVTPRVNEGGHVQMEITQEVSDVSKTTTSGIDSPTINERKFNSTVAVENGDTIALGGLISDNRSVGASGIPGLKDIPLIGNLFKSNSDTDARTELVVLITPRVLHSEQDISRVTDEFRKRLRSMSPPPPQ